MNICVYCGSSPGKNEAILNQAILLGKRLSERGYRLIYGGSSLGIMGALADSVMNNGGEVVGVIPKNLFKKEVAHLGITSHNSRWNASAKIHHGRPGRCVSCASGRIRDSRRTV